MVPREAHNLQVWVQIPPPQHYFVSRRKAAFVMCGENKEFSLFVWDLKLGALCEFLPKAEGEYRESRPGGNRRQAVYQREIPPSEFLFVADFTPRAFSHFVWSEKRTPGVFGRNASSTDISEFQA